MCVCVSPVFCEGNDVMSSETGIVEDRPGLKLSSEAECSLHLYNQKEKDNHPSSVSLDQCVCPSVNQKMEHTHWLPYCICKDVIGCSYLACLLLPCELIKEYWYFVSKLEEFHH